MKKLILVIVICAVIAAVGLTVFYFLRLYKPNRASSAYTEAAITADKTVNDTMTRLLESRPEDCAVSFEIKHRINAADSGVIAEDAAAAEQNTKKLNALISGAKEYTEIFLPAGRYYISSSDGGIKLSQKSNIVIRGEKCELINVSYNPKEVKNADKYLYSNFFIIDGCRNIRLEGIAVDYASHTSADGVITEVKDGKTVFSVFDEFVGGDKNPLEGGEFIASVLIADDNGFTDEYWPQDAVLLEKSGGEFSVPVGIGKAGDKICCRFSSGTYASPVVYINNTSGLTVTDFTCYSCPSAVFYAPYGNSDFCFSEININNRPGSEKLLASNEDCIHIKGLSGSLFVTDSVFSGIGDDALNVHGSLAVINKTAENKISVLRGIDKGSLGNLWAVAGDTVEFFDGSYNSIGTAVVKSFDGKNLYFDALPDGAAEGNYVQNLSFCPDTVIKNCRIESGRARGLLLQTKNAAVTDCTFKKLRLPAILISPDFDYWYEGGYSDNILIQNNAFEGCATAQALKSFGVITVSACHELNTLPANHRDYHKNISIVANSFSDCPAQSVFAQSVVNLKTE